MAEGPLALVRAAILAASPHNTQPWLFRVSARRVELLADPARGLGDFDPYGREKYLGLGCALENMLLAARVAGFAVDLQVEPGRLEGVASALPDVVATLELSSVPAIADPLAAAIVRRRTHRGAFLPDRGLSPEALSAIPALAADLPDIGVVLFSDTEQREAFGQEIVFATEAIVSDAAMVAASDAWFRGDWKELQSSRDGVTVDASGMSASMAAMTKLLPDVPASMAHRHWLRATREVQVASAPVFGLVTVPDLYDREIAVRAGRAWQRIHLWATARGIAVQPLNQPIERVDRERQLGLEPESARRLAGFTGDPARLPTFAFRAGYAQLPARASPRRPVEWVLLS
jgi:hypothetical protein